MKRPVVVKLGSSLVAGAGGRVRRSVLRARSREIAGLVRGGTPVCGGIGVGFVTGVGVGVTAPRAEPAARHSDSVSWTNFLLRLFI